jgi:hypothetical protein
MRRAWRLLMALLRELADENAYRRHLEVHGREPSGEEWRRFIDRRYRPRCCC